jgi:hypothetical protein
MGLPVIERAFIGATSGSESGSQKVFGPVVAPVIVVASAAAPFEADG